MHVTSPASSTTLAAKRYRDLLPIVYKRLAEEWGVHAAHEDASSMAVCRKLAGVRRYSGSAAVPEEIF